MKQIWAMLVMAMFCLSAVPLVAAEDTATTDAGAKAKIDALREKVQIASADYQAAKADYLTARSSYLQKRADFADAQAEWIKCKGVDTPECNAIKADVKGDAKQFLLNAADMVLKNLDALKTKVQASTDMTADEITTAVAEIDAKIAEITAAKAKIEALNENSTSEEINEAKDAIKTVWQSAKKVIKVKAGVLINKRIGGIIVQSERLGVKLDKAIARLEANGKDVSGIDGLKAEFDAKIAEAKTNYETAQQKYAAAKDTKSFDEAVKEAHADMVKAHMALKDARGILKQIVVKIKEQNASQQIFDETDNDKAKETGDNEASE